MESPGGSSPCLQRLKPGLKSMNSIAKADLQERLRFCIFRCVSIYSMAHHRLTDIRIEKVISSSCILYKLE